MKLFIIAMLFPVLAMADAVIFSGNDVKTLKQNIDLFGVAKILSGSVNPSVTATAAPIGSIYLSTSSGMWQKTGAGNTAWTRYQLYPVDLTTDVTGVLPVANGGTGLNGSTAANGSLLIGNGSGYSLSTLTATTNQTTITNGSGTITVGTAQDIATTSSPTFANETLTGDITLSNASFGSIKVGDKLTADASTGVRSGAAMSINADPTKFDIAAGVGYIVDYSTPATPTIKTITIGPFTAQNVTNLASADFTWIMINNVGAIVQQTSIPTPTQRRQNIVLGRLNHSNRTNISFANTVPDFEFSPISQFGDLVDSLGPFNVSGNLISANGANLSMNKSAGTMFHKSYNYSSTTNSPHVISTAVLTPVTFAYQNQTGSPGTYVTVLDPTKYDNAGTTTTVPSSNNATVQRVYLFGSNTLRVQRGQAVYATFANALQGYAQENFVESPLVYGFSVPIAYIIMTKSCTSLLNTACSKIIPAAKFGGSTGGAGSGGTTTLQQAYNNSVQPQVTIDATQLGIQFRDASTPIGSTLLAVQNNAGSTNYLGVDVNGVSATNFVGTGTTGAVRVHNLTTAQKNALTPAAGMIVYDTTLGRLQCYDGAWGDCTKQVLSTQSPTASSSLTLDLTAQRQRIRLTPASAISLSTTVPLGSSAPVDGALIILVGTSDTNTVTFTASDTAKGIYDYDFTLAKGDVVTLIYSATDDRYYIQSTGH